MAIRDVEKYYNEMSLQLKSLKQEIAEMEEDVKNEVMPPEFLDDLKTLIQPLMTNWERISYFMFLLHKPTKKSKEAMYKKQQKKLLSSIGGECLGNVMKAENQAVIEKVKNERFKEN